MTLKGVTRRREGLGCLEAQEGALTQAPPSVSEDSLACLKRLRKPRASKVSIVHRSRLFPAFAPGVFRGAGDARTFVPLVLGLLRVGGPGSPFRRRPAEPLGSEFFFTSQMGPARQWVLRAIACDPCPE